VVWEIKLQFTVSYMRRMSDSGTCKLNVNGETEQKIIIYLYFLIYGSFNKSYLLIFLF